MIGIGPCIYLPLNKVTPSRIPSQTPFQRGFITWSLICLEPCTISYLSRFRCTVFDKEQCHNTSIFCVHGNSRFFLVLHFSIKDEICWMISTVDISNIIALLESVFNHLVLPPKIPGHQDTDIGGIEQCILIRLKQACNTLNKFAGQDLQETWASIDEFFCACMSVTRRFYEKTSILKAFRHLQSKRFLILNIVEQNAALFLRHHVRSVLQ